MKISLSEYKANLDKYMNIALITDVTITSENRDMVWVLSSPKANWWVEKLLPLIQPSAAT